MPWEDLKELWDDSSLNIGWMQTRFRRAVPSSDRPHEWIPTDHLRQVVEHAMSLATAVEPAIEEALAWLDTHHLARSPTAFVIWSVDPELRAHVGTLFTRDGPPSNNTRTGTAGSADFHDILRRIFDDEKSRGPLGFIEALGRLLPHIMWDGSTRGIPDDALDQRLDVFYRPAGVDPVDADLTLGGLAEVQRGNYRDILIMLDDVLAAVRTRLSG